MARSQAARPISDVGPVDPPRIRGRQAFRCLSDLLPVADFVASGSESVHYSHHDMPGGQPAKQSEGSASRIPETKMRYLETAERGQR